jgi:hypothetical protein
MDYLEFREDGTVWGLMTWPPDGGDKIRLNKTTRYRLRGDNQLEITGSCRHQDPCTGVYTLTRTGDSLKITDGSRVLNLQWVGPPAETVPPPAPGPSPSPTPVAETPLSPGDALLFVAGGIQLLDVATGQTEPLVGSGLAGCCPRWSPNRQQVAFSIGAGMDKGIYVVDAEGGAPRLLMSRRRTEGDSPPWQPVWSPDGRYLAVGDGDYI